MNQIDPFHLEAHQVAAVNYNRDVEAFPLLQRILEKIKGGDSLYQSPTDMGVNRAGFAIVEDALASEAAKQEIVGEGDLDHESDRGDEEGHRSEVAENFGEPKRRRSPIGLPGQFGLFERDEPVLY